MKFREGLGGIGRDNSRGVNRHMHGGQYGHDANEGMELFFEHWTLGSIAALGNATVIQSDSHASN